MTTLLDPQQPTAYRRNTWQEAVAEYLPVHRRTPRARWWIERIPLGLVLLLLVGLALRLRNGPMIDEALYINLGHQYLGGPPPTSGETDYLSGAPWLYPVLAAALDSVGGLWLVRLFSLACVVATVVVVERTASALDRSRRVGIMAALVFAVTGPVVMLAMFATFDAVVVLMLALALMVGLRRSSTASALLVGALLALATLTKYTAGPLAAVVVAVLLVAAPRGVTRGLAALGTAAALLGLAWWQWSQTLAPGVSFTTTAREALGPTPRLVLVGTLLLTLGLLLALAIAGALRPGPAQLGRTRTVLANLALLAGGLALPAAQLRIGEGVSFGKHLAYSALFLAPLAGREMAAMSRGMLRLLPVAVLAGLALLVGYVRSDALYHEWVDVAPVVARLEADPKPGIYVSSSSDVLKYATADQPQMTWETTFALYARGPAAIRDAIDEGRYQAVIVRTATTGNPEQDRGQAALLAALEGSSDYALRTAPFPVAKGSTDRWLVYTKKE